VIDIDPEAEWRSFGHYKLTGMFRATLPINTLDPCDHGLGA
jgi:hypothetical protein